MKDYKRGSHTVWDCKYHLVWIMKYRYLVLVGAERSSTATSAPSPASETIVDTVTRYRKRWPREDNLQD